MSVRNILDGTIKVGGDGSMPVEPVIPKDLTVDNLNTDGVRAVTVETENLSVTGTI